MKRWEVVFRVAIVGLLSVIALELGGSRQIADTWRDASRAVKNFAVQREEMPAAPAPGKRGGIDSLYQKEIDASLDEQVRRAAADIPASGVRPQR